MASNFTASYLTKTDTTLFPVLNIIMRAPVWVSHFLFMPNIITRKTAHLDKDPFAASDRVSSNGKGDIPRNVGDAFKRNYDLIDWGRDKKDKVSQ